MRFVLFSLFFALWVFMWWWTYTCHIKISCCPVDNDTRTTKLIEVDRDDPRPLVFRWGQVQPVATAQYAIMRDSLVANLHQGQMLEITGQYFRDELDSNEGPDLGRARASAMRKILATHIDTNLVVVRSKLMSLTGDVRDKFFSALTFRAMTLTPSVQEREDHVVLYLAADTDEMPAAIDSCLSVYRDKLAGSDEKLEITGHTHGAKTARENMILSTTLAQSIVDALVEKGIPAEKITMASRGNSQPLLPPGTEEATRMNTRVEVRIIKKQ